MQKIQGDVKGLGWQAAYDERPFQIGPHSPRPKKMEALGCQLHDPGSTSNAI